VDRGQHGVAVTGVETAAQIEAQNAMPRSTRTILSKPHWWAMSVAFEDQGEIVPSRGVTISRLPAGASPSG
jgi:hypothetical protein